MTHQSSQRGIITLLTLMLMAVITSIAVTASVLMVNELRQTITIGQGIVASYAAEAGMEDGLYTLKKDRDSGTTPLNSGSNTALEHQKPYHAMDNQYGYQELIASLQNGSAWERTAILETSFNITRLNRDQVATLDYYNPGDLSGGGVQSLSIHASDSCDGFSQLEVTMLPFKSLLQFNSSQGIYKAVRPCNISGKVCGFGETPPGWTINNIGVDLDPSVNYRFSFRELVPNSGTDISNCTIDNLSVVGYDTTDAGGDQVPIPAHLTITSTGSFGNTKQAITASVPWKAPVSGLASFVLFSEQDITK